MKVRDLNEPTQQKIMAQGVPHDADIIRSETRVYDEARGQYVVKVTYSTPDAPPTKDNLSGSKGREVYSFEEANGGPGVTKPGTIGQGARDIASVVGGMVASGQMSADTGIAMIRAYVSKQAGGLDEATQAGLQNDLTRQGITEASANARQGAIEAGAMQRTLLTDTSTRRQNAASNMTGLLGQFMNLAQSARPEDAGKIMGGFIAALGLMNHLQEKAGASGGGSSSGMNLLGAAMSGGRQPDNILDTPQAPTSTLGAPYSPPVRAPLGGGGSAMDSAGSHLSPDESSSMFPGSDPGTVQGVEDYQSGRPSGGFISSLANPEQVADSSPPPYRSGRDVYVGQAVQDASGSGIVRGATGLMDVQRAMASPSELVNFISNLLGGKQ